MPANGTACGENFFQGAEFRRISENMRETRTELFVEFTHAQGFLVFVTASARLNDTSIVRRRASSLLCPTNFAPTKFLAVHIYSDYT